MPSCRCRCPIRSGAEAGRRRRCPSSAIGPPPPPPGWHRRCSSPAPGSRLSKRPGSGQRFSLSVLLLFWFGLELCKSKHEYKSKSKSKRECSSYLTAIRLRLHLDLSQYRVEHLVCLRWARYSRAVMRLVAIVAIRVAVAATGVVVLGRGVLWIQYRLWPLIVSCFVFY